MFSKFSSAKKDDLADHAGSPLVYKSSRSPMFRDTFGTIPGQSGALEIALEMKSVMNGSERR